MSVAFYHPPPPPVAIFSVIKILRRGAGGVVAIAQLGRQGPVWVWFKSLGVVLWYPATFGLLTRTLLAPFTTLLSSTSR
jgi:hypothetical protein